eukprot:s760_g3.t1
MVSAGGAHTVLLRSDGCAVACGWNFNGECNIPPLDAGVTYTQVSAGGYHTALLRSDGCAVACGLHDYRECEIPPLDAGVTYTQVSAGGYHTALLRSDGCAVACGLRGHGEWVIPPLDEGVTYTQVSAGGDHTVLLRSDGCAVACGLNAHGECDIPPLDEGVTYTQVSAGGYHTVLLRSDGRAVACGRCGNGACDIPPLDEGVTYTQVSAGAYHTALLRSDGCAVACGKKSFGECDIPPLDEGVTYTQVSAGGDHTVLLRSDGFAVACGRNDYGQRKIPPLKSWYQCLKSWRQLFGFSSPSLLYISDLKPLGRKPERVLQLCFDREADAIIVTCSGLDGLEVLRLRASGADLAADVSSQLALQADEQQLRIVLPDGQLLEAVCTADPSALREAADQLLEVSKKPPQRRSPWPGRLVPLWADTAMSPFDLTDIEKRLTNFCSDLQDRSDLWGFVSQEEDNNGDVSDDDVYIDTSLEKINKGYMWTLAESETFDLDNCENSIALPTAAVCVMCEEQGKTFSKRQLANPIHNRLCVQDCVLEKTAALQGNAYIKPEKSILRPPTAAQTMPKLVPAAAAQLPKVCSVCKKLLDANNSTSTQRTKPTSKRKCQAFWARFVAAFRIASTGSDPFSYRCLGDKMLARPVSICVAVSGAQEILSIILLIS